MRTKKEQEELRNLSGAAEKLMRDLSQQKLYASTVVFSDTERAYVVRIGNIPHTFNGYPIILKPGTVVFARKSKNE